MRNLLNIINTPGFSVQGKPITPNDIALINNELIECNLPTLPDEVASFLLQSNGILHDGRCLWGIDNEHRFIYDILAENLMSNNPTPQDLLLLGATTTTFLAWQIPQKCYSVIDKTSFMVLHNFNNFVEAVKYILKIND